jgi:hypothetical protein
LVSILPVLVIILIFKPGLTVDNETTFLKWFLFWKDNINKSALIYWNIILISWSVLLFKSFPLLF